MWYPCFTLDRPGAFLEQGRLSNIRHDKCSVSTVEDFSVCLTFSFCQVGSEGRFAQPVPADTLLCTEASWDSTQRKQTG